MTERGVDALWVTAQTRALLRVTLAVTVATDIRGGVLLDLAYVLGFGVSKGVIAYATAKAGVVQVTKALALELAFKGVRVNAIAPGWFVTEINEEFLASEKGAEVKRSIPVGRFGTDGDLDGALLLLASKAGGYITGATLVVDGGQVVALA